MTNQEGVFPCAKKDAAQRWVRHVYKYYLLWRAFAMPVIKQSYLLARGATLIFSPEWREKGRQGD
ncbi:hypothetical protein [Kosakonia sp.]|uniref:hypothetical protein n=1 Tax=Kosakonia sp. TaxID=1916651 RepID=UPI0028AC0DED|nr:hypothetical protein [Kosakonia sp.]